MNTSRSITFFLALFAAFTLIACDAEVKVSTTPGDSTGQTDDGDTALSGDDAGATSNGSGTDGGSTNGGTNNGGTNNGGTNGGDTGDDDDSGPHTKGNIRVSSPQAGDLIKGRSFALRGECRTFENTGNYRLRAEDGSILATGHFTATGEMGTFSPYSTTVQITKAYSGDAVLEVFESSAKDGSEINKVSVPLRIGADQATAIPVSVFFTNAQKNPGAMDCSRVYPTTRRPNATSAIARAALEELLRGPTAAEREQLFDTEIPAGTKLRDITINNGTATADFSSELNSAAGSCMVTAIRAQIERTLRQFPTVKRVVITVNGSSSGVLQP